MPLAMSKSYEGAIWDTNFVGTDLSNENQGTIVTANATINTKGSYTTLISATAFDSYGFHFLVQGSNAASTITSQLMDLRIGGSGGQVILPDFQVGARERGREGSWTMFIPIFIPRGTLIEARIQAVITVDTVNLTLFLNSGNSGWPGPLFAGADGYGFTSADSGGTAHTAGNGTPSTLANVGGTLSRDYGAIMIEIHPATGSLGERRYHWEVAVSSVIKAGWLHHSSSGESAITISPTHPHYTNLVSGAQLQVRAECSAGPHDHDVAFHCFY